MHTCVRSWLTRKRLKLLSMAPEVGLGTCLCPLLMAPWQEPWAFLCLCQGCFLPDFSSPFPPGLVLRTRHIPSPPGAPTLPLAFPAPLKCPSQPADPAQPLQLTLAKQLLCLTLCSSRVQWIPPGWTLAGGIDGKEFVRGEGGRLSPSQPVLTPSPGTLSLQQSGTPALLRVCRLPGVAV